VTHSVLAVSSGGGHWVQLLRLRPVFGDFRTTYVTVCSEYRADVHDSPFYVVNDASRWSKVGLLLQAYRICRLVKTVKPAVIVSTGAAPGYFALRFGKLLGATTIWVDSIANVERMSLSGFKVRGYADLWVTQWAHLAGLHGPCYMGNVL